MYSNIESDGLYQIYAEELERYKYLYNKAPIIKSSFNLTNKEAFEYCSRRKFFVITAPYNLRHEILAERTFSNENIKWSLIGGSLKIHARETFLEAASRLAQFTLPSIRISDIEPFAFLENLFKFEGEQCLHRGIAFTGRVRSELPDNLLFSGERTRGQFVSNKLASSEIAISHNQRVFSEAINHVAKKAFGKAPFHEREISINEMYQHRYAVHDKFVKPVFNMASKFHGQHSIGEYKKLEKELLKEKDTNSLIDVACGENELCEQLSHDKQFDLVVGNDISFSQIELLSKKEGGSNSNGVSSLVYTNHDATDMPFEDDQFDIAICKNVLHHMPNNDAVKKLIQETVRISKRALIVEVMNPKYEGRWGRFRHNYYVHFLKDAFVHFLSRDEFEHLITPYEQLYRYDCHTFRGVYFMAILKGK